MLWVLWQSNEVLILLCCVANTTLQLPLASIPKRHASPVAAPLKGRFVKSNFMNDTSASLSYDFVNRNCVLLNLRTSYFGSIFWEIRVNSGRLSWHYYWAWHYVRPSRVVARSRNFLGRIAPPTQPKLPNSTQVGWVDCSFPKMCALLAVILCFLLNLSMSMSVVWGHEGTSS